MKRKEQDYFEIVEKIIDALQLTEDEENYETILT